MNHTGTPGGRPRRDRGAAAVEMALVLPVLLLVLFGVIDFGRMYNTQLTLTEAAREGARASALGQNVNARVAAVTGSLDGTVTTSVVACSGGQTTVTVNYTFEFVTPVPTLIGLGDTMAMQGKGVMSCG